MSHELAERFWILLPVFGLAYEVCVQSHQHFAPILAGIAVERRMVGRNVGQLQLRVGMQIDRSVLFDHTRGFRFIHDGEALTDACFLRVFFDDVMRQTVQSTNAVADIGQEPFFFDEAGDAGGKIVYGRVDQGDDEDLLIVIQISVEDQLGCQRRKGVGLAAAWDGRNTHPAGGVF
ncbi:hypothetical protein SDC9_113921 [bioreactor metagenome]|uniref:Uncharacterized protein n=1 Tax=bioreactor metagenome TaxID=1076179 RepID=A0A645BNQ5_9ZZZZ